MATVLYEVKINCPKCDGSGVTVNTVPVGGGQSTLVSVSCPTCLGTGVVISGHVDLTALVDLVKEVKDKCKDIKDKCDQIWDKVK